ncbi:MAG TPA: ABC transporter substrate-binding protein [Acidimicrobiales bacterium]
MAMGLVLAACSSDDEPAEPDTTGGTAPAAAGDADPEGVITVGYDLVQPGAGGLQLDPGLLTTDTNDGLLYLIYGRLMRPTADGGLEPDMAESVTVVDPNTIEVVVREGQTFHDGTPFDAAAVKAGLDRTLNSGNTRGIPGAFYSLSAVEVTGENTVTLTINDGTAAAWVDTFMGRWPTSIVKEGTDFTKPVGAGPMVVTSYTRDQQLVLDKFDDFWDADAVLTGGLDIQNISSSQAQSALAALDAGQVDFAPIEPNQIATLSGSIEELVVPDPNRLMSMPLCKRDAPLDDARVRQAINKAIDREAISEAVFAGTADPATELWPEGHRFYDPSVADVLAYDVEAAKQLLQEAGYADGFSLDLYSMTALNLPDVAAVAKQQLAEIGVTLNIIPAPGIVNDFFNPQPPGAALIPLMNPGTAKLQQWTGDVTGNTCRWNDQELNDLYAELSRVSETSDEAVELWKQVDQLVSEDALSVLLMFGSNLAGYNSDVIADVSFWPKDALLLPNVYTTYVKAS